MEQGGEIELNKYSVATIDSIFSNMKQAEYEEVLDASVFLYNFVSKEKIYPEEIVRGFFSAMAVIAGLNLSQFLQLKQIY